MATKTGGPFAVDDNDADFNFFLCQLHCYQCNCSHMTTENKTPRCRQVQTEQRHCADEI